MNSDHYKSEYGLRVKHIFMQGWRMSKNILVTIETLLTSFTKTEKKIAEFVLKNHKKVIYMSLTELSDQLSVSEGSIVRFCQKLDLKGFHPFKILLAAVTSDENNTDEIYSKMESGDLNSLKEYLARKNIEVINNTRDMIKSDSLQRCVDMILKSKNILIAGVGSSGNTSQDAFYKFMRMGFNCRTSSDPHILAMMASQLKKGDLLLAISQSGSTLEIVDISNIVKKSGAKVISITGYSRSPLEKYSDEVLLTPTREAPYESGALRSKIAQLYVLELLVTAVYNQNREFSEKNIEKTADSVKNWIY